MERRKMMRICAKLTDQNAVYEKQVHGREDHKMRRDVVERWMWTALMHLDTLGYDVVKPAKKA